MMNRRLFLRNAALLTAGVVAADQLEILERLAPRRLWAGADFTAMKPFGASPEILHSPGVWQVIQSSRLIPDGGYEIVTSSPTWVPANRYRA